jgi:hypothetical protein
MVGHASPPISSGCCLASFGSQSSLVDLGIDQRVRPIAGRPIGLFLVDHTIEAAEGRLVVANLLAVALVFPFAAHVVVGLIEKSDETVDLSARLEAEPADSNKDILRCGILADVQPIKAGYWGKYRRVEGGMPSTRSALGMGCFLAWG